MRRILLPIDYSANSMNAVDYALEMFKNEACEFFVLHVQNNSKILFKILKLVHLEKNIYRAKVKSAKKALNTKIVKLKLKDNNDKHCFYGLVNCNNFIACINQAVAQYDIDLVVMGTKEIKGLKRIIFGSNMIKTIKYCDIPVFVIPKNCKYSGLKTVTFTTSFRSAYIAEDLEPLKDLMAMNDSDLTVLHIEQDNNYAPELFNDIDFFNMNFKGVCFKIVCYGFKSLLSEIKEYVSKNGIKLVAMFNRKHSFFERLFVKYTFESFVFYINTPFLVMNRR